MIISRFFFLILPTLRFLVLSSINTSMSRFPLHRQLHGDILQVIIATTAAMFGY